MDHESTEVSLKEVIEDLEFRQGYRDEWMLRDPDPKIELLTGRLKEFTKESGKQLLIITTPGLRNDSFMSMFLKKNGNLPGHRYMTIKDGEVYNHLLYDSVESGQEMKVLDYKEMDFNVEGFTEDSLQRRIDRLMLSSKRLIVRSDNNPVMQGSREQRRHPRKKHLIDDQNYLNIGRRKRF